MARRFRTRRRFLRPQIILDPFVPGEIYDRPHSYNLVFTVFMVALLISTAMTALLIKPWAKLGTSAQTPIH